MNSKVSGVFRFLTGYAAFVDTVSVAIDGRLRSRIKSHTKLIVNRPIGRSGRIYGRVLEATCCRSGNPVSVNYGKLKPYASVDPFRVTLRSEISPTTLSGVHAVLGSLFWKRYRARVRYVELTFDSHIGIAFFRKHASTKAVIGKWLQDDENRLTFYIGRRTASWQIRCYEKCPGVTRFEFVLRHTFLRRHGIDTLEDVHLLRTIPLQHLVSLKEFRDGLTGRRRQELLRRAGGGRVQHLVTYLATYSATGTAHLLRRCREDVLLRHMQKRLIW